MRKGILMAVLAISINAVAQDKQPSWFNNIKLSGYGMTQYQYSDQESAKAKSVRMNSTGKHKSN